MPKNVVFMTTLLRMNEILKKAQLKTLKPSEIASTSNSRWQNLKESPIDPQTTEIWMK